MGSFTQYILPSIPLAAKLLTILVRILPSFISMFFKGDVGALIFLYVLTVVYAKSRCSNFKLKDIMKKSFIPISFFIGITVFSVIASFVGIPFVFILNMLLSNVFVWLGFGFLIYKPIFNKVFDAEKC